jgi:uncharacterized Zn-finger protein
MLMYSTKLNGATSQKVIKLKARKKPTIPNVLPLIFSDIKADFMSDCPLCGKVFQE